LVLRSEQYNFRGEKLQRRRGAFLYKRDKITKEIDEVEEKAIQIAVNQFVQRTKLPLKYHPFSVALAFMKKAFKDPLLRATLGNQFFDVITNRSGFLESALLHARRTAYF